MEQRWLSKTGICTVLGITESTLQTYVRNKYVVKIGKQPNIRYLDPTPEYTEQLRLGQALHRKQNELPFDVSTAALLTLREVEEIVGWTNHRYAQKYITKHKIPSIKIGRFHLYRVDTVRDILWKRQDRSKVSKQIGPFVISEIIDFFWKYYKAECEETPTDTQFEEDHLLQRKLNRMMRLPSNKREVALAEFMRTMELAKRVVAAAKSSHGE